MSLELINDEIHCGARSIILIRSIFLLISPAKKYFFVINLKLEIVLAMSNSQMNEGCQLIIQQHED